MFLFTPIIPICYWALWKPERAFIGGWRRRALWLVVILLGLWIALAASGPQPFFSLLFIVYPLVYGVLLRYRVRALVIRASAGRIGRFLVVFVLLWLSESFAALDSAITAHDPLPRHMVNYIGFYLGLALVITLFLSRWRFTFSALFTVGGLWGVLVERQFAGASLLLSGDIVSFVVFASVIFPVYGLYLAGPFLLFHEEWSANSHTSRWRSIFLMVAVTVVPLLTWGLWIALLRLFGMDTTILVV